MGGDFMFVQCPAIGDRTTLEDIKRVVNGGELDEAFGDDLEAVEYEIETLLLEEPEIAGGDSDQPPNGSIRDRDIGVLRVMFVRAADLWFNTRRDMSDYGGWLTTGGMSWGEVPTDCYDGIWLLSLFVDELVHVLGIEHPDPRVAADRATHDADQAVRRIEELESRNAGLAAALAVYAGGES